MARIRTVVGTLATVAIVAAVSIVPAAHAAPSNRTTVDASPVSIVDGRSFYETSPTVTGAFWGETLVFHAEEGFFTRGPQGDWPGGAADRGYDAGGPPSGAYSTVRIADWDTKEGGGSAPAVITVTADGSELRIQLPSSPPAGSGDWYAEGGRVTINGFEHCEYDPEIAGEECGEGESFQIIHDLDFYEMADDRLAGADRFATSVEISQDAFPGTAEVVYVATGLNYPDALAAGPAAAAAGGPVLLTAPTDLPDVVAAEIERLEPSAVMILGSPASISVAVEQQLDALVGAENVVRFSGVDRYDTGRQIVANAFPTPVSVVYLATGQNFPDALSAGAVGANTGAPVVLVNGLANSVDDATLDLLAGLDPAEVRIVGGTPSVSAGIEEQLDALYFVHRLAGADRFATSVAINENAYATADTALLATGLNFPDALAGAALAAASGAPLYVTLQNCIPAMVHESLGVLDVSEVVLLGGTPTLSNSVASLTRC